MTSAIELSCDTFRCDISPELGWHPYFVKRQRSRISFEATGRWEMSIHVERVQ